MKYFELETKGLHIANSYNNAWEIELLLRQIITSFYEANTAFNLYIKNDIVLNSDMGKSRRSLLSKEDFFKESYEIESKRRRFAVEINNELGIDEHNYEEMEYQIDIKQKRERWLAGETPLCFTLNEQQIYAKSFVYALDTIVETIGNLISMEGVSELVSIKRNEINEKFPDLRGVRNTTHHMGDRSVGLKVVDKNKKVPIKRDKNGLILNNLINSELNTLMGNGKQGSISISNESMEAMRAIVQDILDSFDWYGFKQHYPMA
ncbi:hypothetical protein ACXLRS_000707 [Citrobacter youngae]